MGKDRSNQISMQMYTYKYEYSEFLQWILHLVNFGCHLTNILLLCLCKIPQVCCVHQVGIINRQDYDAMISW